MLTGEKAEFTGERLLFCKACIRTDDLLEARAGYHKYLWFTRIKEYCNRGPWPRLRALSLRGCQNLEEAVCDDDDLGHVPPVRSRLRAQRNPLSLRHHDSDGGRLDRVELELS